MRSVSIFVSSGDEKCARIRSNASVTIAYPPSPEPLREVDATLFRQLQSPAADGFRYRDVWYRNWQAIDRDRELAIDWQPHVALHL